MVLFTHAKSSGSTEPMLGSTVLFDFALADKTLFQPFCVEDSVGERFIHTTALVVHILFFIIC